LRQAHAAGYLGPISVTAAIAYLMATYPRNRDWIRNDMQSFIASGQAMSLFWIAHPQRLPKYQSGRLRHGV
jgi:hypothetical protein